MSLRERVTLPLQCEPERERGRELVCEPEREREREREVCEPERERERERCVSLRERERCVSLRERGREVCELRERGREREKKREREREGEREGLRALAAHCKHVHILVGEVYRALNGGTQNTDRTEAWAFTACRAGFLISCPSQARTLSQNKSAFKRSPFLSRPVFVY